MSPPYGWPIAGRYCATAGFFHPLCGMAVTLSFGRDCEKKRGGFISSRTAMEKMSEDKHPSNNR